MKKFLSKLLFGFLSKEIEQIYVSHELPKYEMKMGDEKTMRSISDLYLSEEYRTLVRLLGNRRSRLGNEMLRMRCTNKYQDTYWRGFYRGQAHLISNILSLVRHIHRRYEAIKDKKKGKK